jgi:hypothetical protein
MMLSERRRPYFARAHSRALRLACALRQSLLIGLGALLLSACGALSMKPPKTPLPMRTVAVHGHAPSNTGRDSELSIGTAKVSEVAGTAIYPPGLTAYGRMPDQTAWNYQYKVRDGQSALRGECVEQVGEVRYYGLGETTLDVSCHCFAGDQAAGEVSIKRGEGKATLLPAHRFAVFGTRGAKQGGRSREILGYRFQSGKSVGAIDVTKLSGAYYADNLSSDEQHALTCLYAGILLHRAHR